LLSQSSRQNFTVMLFLSGWLGAGDGVPRLQLGNA